MSGFVAGSAVGVLTAAAVYYTYSTSFRVQTDSMVSDISALSAHLSAPQPPTGPTGAPRAYVPPSKPPLSELVKERWNDEVFGAVRKARDFRVEGLADAIGRLVGKAKEAVEGLGETNESGEQEGMGKEV